MSQKESAGVAKENLVSHAEQQVANRDPIDLEFWHQRFDEYRLDLFYYACKLTNGNTDEASDVLQEVFLRLERYCKKRDEVRAPKPYLIFMVRNAYFDSLPKKKLVSLDDPDFSPDQINQPAVDPRTHQILENKNMLDFLGEGLQSPDEEVYRLMRQGRSAVEIAEICGMSMAEVILSMARIKYHTRKKVKKLKRRLPDIKRTGGQPQKAPTVLRRRIRARK